SLHSLEVHAYASGDLASARGLHEESLGLFRELGDRRGGAVSLGGLAAVMLAQTEIQKSVRLWGAIHVLRESLGTPRPPPEQEKYDQLAAQARLTLGEDVFTVVWGEGQTMTWEQAVAIALKAGEGEEVSSSFPRI
ncbi:MAG: hypothetical protein JWN14_4224, partial [Chthonomonadales bacterium]|nr:hypothetical protein [Chthonomonadales bacterium]